MITAQRLQLLSLLKCNKMNKNNSPWKSSKKQILDVDSPKVQLFANGSFGRRLRAKDALAKRMQKVSQRAALVGKQKVGVPYCFFEAFTNLSL